MGLTDEAQGELDNDLAAVEALCELFPDEVPHPLEVWDRITDPRKRRTPREQAFLAAYYDRAEEHRVTRGEAAIEDFLSRLEGAL